MKNVVGNWQLAPIYTYESPEYGTVQSGVDTNVNGDAAGDRAIFNPFGIANTGTGVNPADEQRRSGRCLSGYQSDGTVHRSGHGCGD